MIKWCTGCHSYQGEAEPFASYEVIPLECPSCAQNHSPAKEGTSNGLDRLRQMQAELRAAAQNGSPTLVKGILEQALQWQIAPVDLAMGLILPLLQDSGERGGLNFHAEYRVTRVCSKLIDLARERTTVALAPYPHVLLFNAPGSVHFLSQRLMELWLQAQGIPARSIAPASHSQILAAVAAQRPRVVGFSIGTMDQVPATEAVIRALGNRGLEIWASGPVIKDGRLSWLEGARVIRDPLEMLERLRPVAPHAEAA